MHSTIGTAVIDENKKIKFKPKGDGHRIIIVPFCGKRPQLRGFQPQ